MMDQVERLLLVASGAELSAADVTTHACGKDQRITDEPLVTDALLILDFLFEAI